MMERSTGPPLGIATQSSRPMGDFGMPRMPAMNTVRRVPPNGNPLRHAPSNSSNSSSSSISGGVPSASQVVAFAREAMRNAIEHNKAAEGEMSSDLKPGVTIDLSHKEIQWIPEEVIDIIKHELERLALSHNQIAALPSKFSECSSLRYLNIRNNSIREIPQSICLLTGLEILDLCRNKIKTLPPELVKLSSLKVLSVERNRIEVIPLFIADMATLSVLRVAGNPIVNPPREVLEPADSPSSQGTQDSPEHENRVVTSQIKVYLRQKALQERSEAEPSEEDFSEGIETPRPMKRVMSGRFPVRVNGSDIVDLRSPALPRPPPIPSRSHYRGLSQQNAALRRPGVAPLTINGQTANERVRSNSENILQGPRSSSSADRRRMGMVTKKSDLGTVDETKSNRNSHYKSLSHGSAMTGNGNDSMRGSRGPVSPADSAHLRSAYVRRLSSLPERKRKSNSPDILMEGARGIQYALFQIHPHIESLLELVRGDVENKRSSLEMVFYSANTQVGALDLDIQAYATQSEEDEETAPHLAENLHRACLTSISAYMKVCELLVKNVKFLLENSEPRYIRTLLLMIYGGLAEVRNAGADLFRSQRRIPSISERKEPALRILPRDKSMTPTRDRPGTSRSRSGTVLQYTHGNNLRVATDTGPPPLLSANLLSNATPRSGDSFTSSNGGRLLDGNFSDNDRKFDNIFLNLQQTADMSMRNIPAVISHFQTAMDKCSHQVTPELPRAYWEILIQTATSAMYITETLKSRLSSIKLKEPGIRTQGAFWELCNAFVEKFLTLLQRVKEAKSQTSLLSSEVIVLLRPIQKAVKDCGTLIGNSPWAHLAVAGQHINGSSGGSSFSVQSPASQVPLPMTPQSAALGPAAQATIPSTPQSSAMFSNSFFERADLYLASGNVSASSSRSGTMTSNDGSVSTNSTMLSPMNSMNSRFNFNNGKVSF